MILFICTVQNGYIYRDREQIGGRQGLGGEEDEQKLLNGEEVLLLSDRNMLELDRAVTQHSECSKRLENGEFYMLRLSPQ